MSYLYRHGLTITRKQPYLDWANGLEDEGPPLSAQLSNSRRSIYLVPETDGEPDLEALVAEFWEDVFEEELGMWVIAEER